MSYAVSSRPVPRAGCEPSVYPSSHAFTSRRASYQQESVWLKRHEVAAAGATSTCHDRCGMALGLRKRTPSLCMFDYPPFVEQSRTEPPRRPCHTARTRKKEMPAEERKATEHPSSSPMRIVPRPNTKTNVRQPHPMICLMKFISPERCTGADAAYCGRGPHRRSVAHFASPAEWPAESQRWTAAAMWSSDASK